ncbi:malonyl CoA-ACP transacylase [Idiomarina sp. HP20-50]|uniref:malonyl CoA-ACP transacylase n=1 Tax=Idiomarina sp. HP20-50 TaxID=3070813 RepID=UPI00294B5B77|nr:malonyl CoA-ACP transacylase [Idiomarina sp. HP20-50]MDV6316358.1 malonyl CoA-ACP transacylase [Idiomarina sp. HP20-50]
MKQTAVIVCPGRGGYNKPELGSISHRHLPQQNRLISSLDKVRENEGLLSVSELDQKSKFDRRLHLKPENSAALIFAAGYADFKTVNPEEYEIVAVTGNSMGWYTALACAGVWKADNAMSIVTDMAKRTAEAEGAQLIYPVMNEQWQPDKTREQAVSQLLMKHAGELFLSIRYGGYVLLAGTENAINAASKALEPVDDRFPMILPGHAAFHSPLMKAASEQALAVWNSHYFRQPELPLIDGRGVIWEPPGCDLNALQNYTFGHQVTEYYDYTKAITVALREFAPDKLLLLGPGNSLGGATGQSLVAANWRNLSNKDDFVHRQESEKAPVISLGL